MKSGERNITFDIMKGIAIVSVIIGHDWIIPFNPYRNFIYSYHLPLFFLVAGYFYHPKVDFKAFLKHDFKRLIVPYLFTSSVLLIYQLIHASSLGNVHSMIHEIGAFIFAIFYASGGDHSCLLLSHLPNIGAIWFLPAMMVCKQAYNYINLRYEKKAWLIIVLVSLSATLIDRFIINIPFAILPGLSAMVFYLIGDKIKNINITPLMVGIAVICWIISILNSHIYMFQCSYGLYPIDVIGACGGTICIYYLSKALCKINGISRFMSWLGRCSLSILCFHLIVDRIGLGTGISANMNNSYPCIFLLCSITLPIVCAWICTHIDLTKRIFYV